MAALYAALGLFYTLAGIVMVVISEGPMRMMGMVYIFMPVLLGIFGFIFFAIFAALYNLFAGALGGVEFEVEDIEEY